MEVMELIRMKNEISETAAWGELTERFYVHELSSPTISGPLACPSTGSVGCAYFDRTILLIRIGGGHLVAPPKQLVAEITKIASKRERQPTPASQLRATINWLDEEQREGLLQRSFATVSVLVIVSSVEILSWHVGPHGTFSGAMDKLLFRSTDARMPVLYKLGFPTPASRFPGWELRDKSSSGFLIMGLPTGSECTRHEVGPNSIVVETDRGTFPFGPLGAEESCSLKELWNKDAAWRHGLPGRALVIGRMPKIEIPFDWKVQTTVYGDG